MVSRSSARKGSVYFPTKILKPEGRSWCEDFSPPLLEKLVLKTAHRRKVIVIVVVSDDTYYWFTCPQTVHFKFITKSDSLFYYIVRRSVITKCDDYYKVRQKKDEDDWACPFKTLVITPQGNSPCWGACSTVPPNHTTIHVTSSLTIY